MSDASADRDRAPTDWRLVAGAAAAVAFVAAAGTGLAAVLPERSLWLVAGAYAGPAALAFMAYWWAAQRA